MTVVMRGCNFVAAVDCSRSRVAGDDDAGVNRSIQTELGSTRTCRRHLHRRRRGPTGPLVWVGTEVSRSLILDGGVLMFVVVWML